MKRRIVSWLVNSRQLWSKISTQCKRTTYLCRGSATWKCWCRSNRSKMSKNRSKLRIYRIVWRGSEMKPKRRRSSSISCKPNTRTISRGAVRTNFQCSSWWMRSRESFNRVRINYPEQCRRSKSTGVNWDSPKCSTKRCLTNLLCWNNQKNRNPPSSPPHSRQGRGPIVWWKEASWLRQIGVALYRRWYWMQIWRMWPWYPFRASRPDSWSLRESSWSLTTISSLMRLIRWQHWSRTISRLLTHSRGT